MPAVEESYVSSRLLSLAADSVETWRLNDTHVSAPRAAPSLLLYHNPNALWLHHFQIGITAIRVWLRNKSVLQKMFQS